MNVMMVVLKAILKLLEVFVNGNSGSSSDNNISMNSSQQPQHNNTNNATFDPSQNNLSLRIDNSTRLEQMWEVYNRVIKMKEEQARSDAEEIVKLRFKIEDLQDELARERRINTELRTKIKKHNDPPDVNEDDNNQGNITQKDSKC